MSGPHRDKIKFVKDEALPDEIVGEFDNKKNQKDENN